MGARNKRNVFLFSRISEIFNVKRMYFSSSEIKCLKMCQNLVYKDEFLRQRDCVKITEPF